MAENESVLVLNEVKDVELEKSGQWANVGVQKDSTPGPRAYVCYRDEEAEVFEPLVEKTGARVLVAPWGNIDYEQSVEKGAARIREIGGRSGGTVKFPEGALERVLIESEADHILLDWRNIAGPNGTGPVPYSAKVGATWLKKDPHFRKAVRKFAQVIAEEIRARDEKDAADLGNASSGSSSGTPTSKN